MTTEQKPEVAIYTVYICRELGESDGQAAEYHDGTGAGACEQVARELQEAIDDSGSLDGFFQMGNRWVATWEDWDELKANAVHWVVEDAQDDPK